MIDGLDTVIRQTILSEIPSLSGRVGFQPPDELWRQRVTAGTGLWLNCALVDLREDRVRRSNEIRIQRDPPRRFHAPFLLRCHYLVSAWNSAKDSEAVPASMQEHGLLGRVISALLDRGPLTPSRVLLPAELTALPESWREAEFETDILPAEGFPKIPEFWGTMGRGVAWRPVIWLAVTVPVSPNPTIIDGVVETILTSLGHGLQATAEEELLTLGGIVLDAAGVPVDESLVTLSRPTGSLLGRAITTADGRFVLDAIPPGTYDVSARAASHAPLAPISVTLPTPVGGQLELQFT